MFPSRRRLLSLLSSIPLLGLALPVSAAVLRTPRATEGPYYPTGAMRFADVDNNLVQVTDAVRAAGGEVIVLKGRVLTAEGAPIAGARVEIWQCDVNGIYLHTRDRGRGNYDTGFQGFGHVVTGADGVYAFRTIKPVVYPGRTPHIHVKVFAQGHELTSQFYLEGHPLNADDFLFRRMSEAERRAVSMVFAPGADGPEAVVDIVV